jgi:hypothetical protein
MVIRQIEAAANILAAAGHFDYDKAVPRPII